MAGSRQSRRRSAKPCSAPNWMALRGRMSDRNDHVPMTRRVPLNDLVRQGASIQDELAACARRVVERGWFVLGSECDGFEAEFAAYCGSAHCIGVANGTDAIELALRGLGIGAGYAVATVANAGFYSSTAIHAIGAAPVYVDVKADSHAMDSQSLQQALAAKAVRAVIVTHLYGRLAD